MSKQLESKNITAGLLSNQLIRVKVGELRDTWTQNPQKVSRMRKLRQWWRKTTTPNRLRNIKRSVVKFGYDPEKYGYIAINKKYPGTKKQYNIVDGNHRVRVLRELYGEDYKVTVSDVTAYFTPDDLEVNGAESATGRIKQGLPYIPIMYYPSIIFFIWYMLLEVILFSIFCYILLMFIRNRAPDRLTDTHPKKGLTWAYNKSPLLYEIIMNIYYNSRNIILAIAFLWYVYYIISNYFSGILIITGITILIIIILKSLGLPVILNLKDITKKIKNI